MHRDRPLSRTYPEAASGPEAADGFAGSPVSRRAFIAALGLGAGACCLSLATGCSSGEPSGSSAASSLAVISDSEAAPRRLTLAMVGDVLVHPGVWKGGVRSDGTRNYDHIYAPLKPVFEAADIAMVNQETILGGDELGLSGYPSFCSPQEFGDAEVAAGIDVALAATNHALDKGYAGIEAELEYWRENHPDMVCCGIATSQEEYDAVPIVERNGIKAAILNYTESTNGIPIPSSAPWCVRMLERDKVAADVALAREQGADVVVVCPHWGIEYRYEPTDGQRDWAGFFLEQGVDAVIGTHPHVIEPLELLEDGSGHRMPVFWSLGNFTSWQARKDTMVGGLAQLTFEKGGGAVSVASAALTPVISHLSASTAMATYAISDYTEELAAQNGIRRTSGCADFTLAWCQDFCAQVLGEGYDREKGVFTLAL